MNIQRKEKYVLYEVDRHEFFICTISFFKVFFRQFLYEIPEFSLFLFCIVIIIPRLLNINLLLLVVVFIFSHLQNIHIYTDIYIYFFRKIPKVLSHLDEWMHYFFVLTNPKCYTISFCMFFDFVKMRFYFFLMKRAGCICAHMYYVN